MNLFVTIFGGMLLTLVLYALGRGVRLSNFWAAVMASAIPTFVYLGYAAMITPGLDTITMHVIAFPTVAVMLFLMYGEKADGRGTHWVPKLLVGFFLVITILYGGFVYIAKQGLPPQVAALLLPNASKNRVHTGFAGVVAHGEDAAKTIGQHRAMDEKLARLGWHVDVVGLDALRPDHVNQVQVLIRDKDGVSVSGVKVSLALGRPGQPPQETIDFTGVGSQGYQAMVGLPGDGVWLAAISLAEGAEQVELQHTVGGE